MAWCKSGIRVPFWFSLSWVYSFLVDGYISVWYLANRWQGFLDGWVCIYTVVINLSHILFYFGWRVLRETYISNILWSDISILGESSFLGWRIWQDVCVCLCVLYKTIYCSPGICFLYSSRGVVAVVCVCAFLCSSFFYLFRNDQWQH